MTDDPFGYLRRAAEYARDTNKESEIHMNLFVTPYGILIDATAVAGPAGKRQLMRLQEIQSWADLSDTNFNALIPAIDKARKELGLSVKDMTG